VKRMTTWSKDGESSGSSDEEGAGRTCAKPARTPVETILTSEKCTMPCPEAKQQTRRGGGLIV
jgi:hypothetical protein